MDPLLDGLNPAQRTAVEHVEGPLLILAGPGSGKTRVVTHRIANLVRQGVHPGQVLALTFTNKAAQEMANRVNALLPGQRVWVSTFHRFGVRMLRQYADLVGISPNFTIYDTSDARATLKRVLEAERISVQQHSPERIAAAISTAKNRLVTPEEYQPRSGQPLSHVVAKAYPAYQARLLASSAVDFDDLLLLVARLMHDNPEVRAELDARFRYVLVDEYQDTNRAQYVLLRALSCDYPNLAATGDPDQSIYGWRGADLSNILDFERDFGAAKVVRLEQNYRSTKSVLRVADALISHNRKRKPKSLFTDNPEGAPVALATYLDQDDEARDIAQQIRHGVEHEGRRWSDFAVFYRINALSRSVERALRTEGVPFQMVRGLEFFQRKEIKDVLAYCQLVNNPKDDVAFERTVNTPARGIGKKTVDLLNAFAYRRGVSLLEAARSAGEVEGLSARARKLVGGYVATIDRIAAHALGAVEEVIGSVLTETGYRDRLLDTDDEEDSNRLANIEELLTDSRQFDEQQTGPDEGGLEAYLERTWLVNDIDNWDADSDKATLMTLHAAKGLEFPVVFMVALEDSILPHERSLSDPDQLEEERRLAFVGITRAKERLQLSHVMRRDFRGVRRAAIPSSFLMELPLEELERRTPSGVRFEADPWCDDLDAIPEDDAPTVWLERVEDEAPSQPLRVAAAKLTTAAALAGEQAPQRERVSPEVFALGMAVLHPELGPGKIVTLSGSGRNRRATVRFATAGERSYVLCHSPLRPAAR